MDLAQTLVRSCARTFLDTRHILVVDALVVHSAINDSDLSILMGMTVKEVHKLCGKLREDRFIAVHTRAEIKEGQTRPINRTYYYIDYRATVDAIKWKVYLIDKEVQGNTIPEEDRKEYFCKRCTSQWTQMEVLDKFGPEGFLCHKCGYLLVHDPESSKGGHEQSTKLNSQFKFITELLPKLDEVIVPENTFDQALSKAVKVQRDETNQVAESTVVASSSARPTAVSGMKAAPQKLNVSLGEETAEVDAAAERARKAKLAAQNALPVHFTHSTISGEQVKFDPNSSYVPVKEEDKKDTLDTSVNGDSGEIDDYFARLKAEQAREAEREKDEEFETDDEEEEDDFEDVIPTAAGSGAGTPSSTAGENKPTSVPAGLTSALKRSGSASASGTSTGVTSPATGPGTPNEDGRPSKKVRIEEPEQDAAVKEEVESEEEDLEFEDV